MTDSELNVPDGQPALDGKDFSNELLGDAVEGSADREIYALHRNQPDKWALRLGDWKIVAYKKSEPDVDDWQLFNLARDPKETTNVASAHRDRVDELHDRFVTQRSKDLKRANYPFEVGSLDPSQQKWYERYRKQENAPEPDKQLINQFAEPDLQQDGFRSLFNGKDLSGWTPLGGECKFEVEDGCIVGTCVPGSASTYLSTFEDDFDDFIFTCELKWDVDCNSGVMFRAASRKQGKRDVVYGPQAEMEGVGRDRGWSGGIYGQSCGGYFYPLWLKEHAEARHAIKENDWNRVTIYAKGNTVRTWINGIPAAEWEDDGSYPEGFFGLQVHKGEKGKVRFRNLHVKESP